MTRIVPCIMTSLSKHPKVPTGSKARSGWGRLTPVLAGLALVLFAQGNAFARPNYPTFFNSKYGTSGTPLGGCTVCHPSGSSLNPYGDDFANAGSDEAALDAIAGIDSDGDGATNITEINALTFPGDATSTPPVVPVGLPVPAAQSVIPYAPVTSPLISDTAETARPVALGQVAVGGGTVDVGLGLDATAGPVDVYFGLQINGGEILLLTSNLQFQAISSGVVPFAAGSMGGFNQTLFSGIPVSALPPANYTLYMMVTPAGSTAFATYYLYITGFTVGAQ